jgi:AraC-like DNA-binding protein
MSVDAVLQFVDTRLRVEGIVMQRLFEQSGCRCMSSAPLRVIRAGVERLSAGLDMPRHRHAEAYVTVVLAGRYDQVGYAGRLAVEAGDIVLQSTLDCHADHMLSPGVEILRLPWSWTEDLGGIYRGADVELIRNTANRDQAEAESLVRDIVSSGAPTTACDDWEDIVALRLRDASGRVGDIADELGMSREALSRGFARAYGVPPVAFRCELRARNAWLKILSTRNRLCEIALEAGFSDQPHMTRAIREMTGSSPASWRSLASADLLAPHRPGVSLQDR